MLNFQANTGRAGSAWLAGLLDQDCTLCGAHGDAVVCSRCAASFARVLSACVRCAIPITRGRLCRRCRAHAPAFDAALAVFEYRFPIDRLVQRFKYAGDLAVGHWLAAALAERVGGGERPELLVAPPSTTERLRERGFNPGLEIAKAVGRALDLPCAIEGLARARETTPQPGLGRRAREENLAGTFRCALQLEGAHVAVVDDVMTTGATASAAARVLRRCGARRVTIWAVARTPERNDAKEPGV